MNFSHGDYIANTPSMLRNGRIDGKLAYALKLRCLIPGIFVSAKQLVKEGLIDNPVMVQLCMGIPYGAPDDPNTLMALVNNLQNGYSAFAIGRNQLPYAALAPIVGGNVRGLRIISILNTEAMTNAQLVERAATILSAMNIMILRLMMYARN